MFGVHIGKSGTCYVSVVTSKGDRLIQAFDRSGVMIKSFPARATKAGKPFEPYQVVYDVINVYMHTFYSVFIIILT